MAYLQRSSFLGVPDVGDLFLLLTPLSWEISINNVFSVETINLHLELESRWVEYLIMQSLDSEQVSVQFLVLTAWQRTQFDSCIRCVSFQTIVCCGLTVLIGETFQFSTRPSYGQSGQGRGKGTATHVSLQCFDTWPKLHPWILVEWVRAHWSYSLVRYDTLLRVDPGPSWIGIETQSLGSILSPTWLWGRNNMSLTGSLLIQPARPSTKVQARYVINVNMLFSGQHNKHPYTLIDFVSRRELFLDRIIKRC